jgi:murein DD-endopeptidase MepM/ murein hydrolase activator NlpD
VCGITTTVFGGSVRPASLGKSANESTCAVTGPTTGFSVTDSEAFVAFIADRVAAGETLRIDWVAPSGEIESSVPYDGLPAARSLCFVSHLPIAGFQPAANPGTWQVRIYWNQQLAQTRSLVIAGEPNTGVARISSVSRNGANALTLDGRAFTPGSVVHLAQLSGRTWRYIHAAIPTEATPTRLQIEIPKLPVGEYLAVIRDERDRVSNSARFVIATRESYRLPLPAGEPWMLTQGPYGGFSHYGQALHAFDIAPVRGRCLVAMRGGTVHAYDRGMVQSHASRTFGNYITIDHGDGEYSHYAHLATGTFVVRTGQRVEQGQALATVGNSGYTFPMGGGHHVHVHVTRSFGIASQSIPFEFEDLRASSRHRGVIVSSNSSPLCNCARPVAPQLATAPVLLTGSASAAPPRPGAKTEKGSAPFSEWWNTFVTVRPGVRTLEVSVTPDPGSDVDLHLVSPSGKHYGWYGDTTGYSGQEAPVENFVLPTPEPGRWRISVQAVRSDVGQATFRLETFASTLTTASTRNR